ncbi:cell wall metabolism sensor histidine kinase WalK [Halobacillus sp. A5]|uniref:sensor histidine kinase n=1 Tax=Halobacillus sp. A5 TaxID=2880263 RepID=UPI0020A65724|nr:HAMP domain-containing sensor histidine kinase [Halobacillus sp. A5]MCP3029220.1 HAMP domain-containing histidine kinase [Halobacillus sp. A5]
MSIRKKFTRSNLAIVIIPALLFLAVEGYLLLYTFDFSAQQSDQLTFISIHIAGWLVLLLITNALFIYFVTKHVIKPMKSLTKAAEEVSAGQMETPFIRMKKDEIGKLADSFENLRLQLMEAEDVKEKYAENRKKLLYNISTDLRLPMTFIKEQIELVKGDEASKEEVDAALQALHMKSIVLERLVDELFQHSELDMGRLAFYFKKVELRSFLVEVMEEFQMEWEEVTFTFEAEKVRPYEAKADPAQLKRVMVHLINNCLRFMDKETKKINIHLKEKQGEIIVEVMDNGPGILDHDLPHIFELFYQSEQTKMFSEGGSGLGLPISKRIIEEHEGTIKAASRIGHGTTITFTLPSYES